MHSLNIETIRLLRWWNE